MSILSSYNFGTQDGQLRYDDALGEKRKGDLYHKHHTDIKIWYYKLAWQIGQAMLFSLCQKNKCFCFLSIWNIVDLKLSCNSGPCTCGYIHWNQLFWQRDLQGCCYFFGGKARGRGGEYLNTSVVHMHDQRFTTLHLYFVTLLSLNPVPRGWLTP